MQKSMKFAMMLAGLTLASGAAAQDRVGLDEVGTQTAGHDELLDNQPLNAIAEIEAMGGLELRDPAALINLGQAYRNAGRTSDAIKAFERAMDGLPGYYLVLTGGQVMHSRDAARIALRNTTSTFASN